MHFFNFLKQPIINSLEIYSNFSVMFLENECNFLRNPVQQSMWDSSAFLLDLELLASFNFISEDLHKPRIQDEHDSWSVERHQATLWKECLQDYMVR